MQCYLEYRNDFIRAVTNAATKCYFRPCVPIERPVDLGAQQNNEFYRDD